MQKLEVLIEENAFGSVRPVEVVADAPVAALVSALVEELNLPQTDLFGKKLVYMLRQAGGGGRVIPEHGTLISSGVRQGARLTLDSYVLDGSVATMEQQLYTNPSLYSSVTVADVGLPPVPQYRGNTSAAHLPVAPKQQGRNWTRRAILAAGGAILGAGGVGLGYAAYQKYLHLATTPATTHQATQPTTAPRVNGQVTKQAQQPMMTVPTTAKATLVFTKHQQNVRTVGWSPASGLMATASDDMHVLIWDLKGAVQHDLQHPAAVRALAWSPDGQRLVTGANIQVAFFNAQTGAQLAHSTHRHMQMVNSVAWGVQGQMRVVSGGADMRAIVWDTNNYQSQTVYTKHTVPINVVSWASDGQTVASCSQGGQVHIWNAGNGQDVHGYFQDGQVPLRAMAFAPMGTQLAVGGDDGVVRFWNGLTCTNANNRMCMDVPQRVQVSQKAVRALAWSPDARFLAVGADDGMFSLWMPGQGQKPLFTIQQKGIVRSITWSPDGKQLATAADAVVTVWMLA